VNTLATIIGLASGFVLIGYHEPAAEMIATSLMVDVSLAPLTAVIASRRGRSATLWAAAGFFLGMWALAYVLIFKPRRSETSEYPPESDAA
jgi:type IV secretory pathway TrbD component